MKTARYHTKSKAIEEIENVEKLSLLDGKLALLKVEVKQIQELREQTLQKILKNYKLPKDREILIPFDDIPYLKGTARTITTLDQDKALKYILRNKSLKGMKITATKEVLKDLPKTYQTVSFSKHNWRPI
jgi:hypothetical protein